MKLFKLLILGFFVSISSASIAADGPLELVHKTADDVLAVLKADDSIQQDKEKIYKLAEEKNSTEF